MNRVLFVRSTPYDEDNTSYNVQGIGIAKAFCRLGYNCDYLNFNKRDESVTTIWEENGCVARVINKKRLRLFRMGINTEVLKEEFLGQYDYVICREYNQIMTYLMGKHHPNVSMYSGPYWNMFMLPFSSPIYDALLTKKIDRLMRCKFVKSVLAGKFLEEKGYTDLIDVGVGLDTGRFQGVTITDSTRELANYMTENPCLLYVGTLDENKNLPFLLEVFQSVRKTHKDLKLVLIGKSKQNLKNKLLGKGDDSYAREVLDALPGEVRQSIHHVQRVDNTQLQFIYPLAKAFLLPSKKEIFGMVMLEAMYFGAPVVTSYNGGSSSLIKSSRYGQAIREFDVSQWTDAVNALLDDPGYAGEVSANCKELVSTCYNWDYIVGKMMEEIKSAGISDQKGEAQ